MLHLGGPVHVHAIARAGSIRNAHVNGQHHERPRPEGLEKTLAPQYSPDGYGWSLGNGPAPAWQRSRRERVSQAHIDATTPGLEVSCR